MHGMGELVRGLGDTMNEVRARTFVGRERELRLLSNAGEASERRVFWLVGPGGIGKSTLLARVVRDLEARGRRVVQIDGEDASLGVDALALTARGVAPSGVLVVDGFENLEPVWNWFRERLLPSLDARVAVIVASRAPIPARWRTDPAWSAIAEEIAIGPLGDEDARVLACSLGVSERRIAGVVALAGGHPLTLWLVAHEETHGTSSSTGEPSPGAAPLRAALTALLDRCPTGAHLDAMRAGLMAVPVTESLLADTLDIDAAAARRVVRWLEAQPFTTATPVGLRFHPLVIEAASREDLFLDPHHERVLRHRLEDALVARLTHATYAEVLSLLVPFQRLLSAERLHILAGVASSPRLHHRVATDADWPEVLAAVARVEGEVHGRLASAWRAAGVTFGHVVRDDEERLVGYAVFLDLVPAVAQPVDDPTIACWLERLHRSGGALDPSARAVVSRFFGSTVSHQAPSPALHAIHDLNFVELCWPRRPVVASMAVHADFDAIVARPDLWLDVYGRIDLSGRSWAIVGIDWRRHTLEKKLRTLIARVRGASRPAEVRVALGAALRDEVKRALPRIHGEALQTSALATCAAVRERCVDGEPPARALANLLSDVCRGATAAGHVTPHDAAILTATFLRGASDKQLAIAKALGMGYSTYRRHLVAAVEHAAREIDAIETAARERTGELG
ncbi:MAG: AAA family ATPase [Labilithrix sp.]|nr:AAA family ATPase [Labilithrix sp.]MCW5812065.1 AAA family ATPase [Labilithrix sp.]